VNEDDLAVTTPTVVVTNEFGGDFGDSFTGFSAGFNWATVPEPSTLTLAGLAALGLIGFGVRQRRQRSRQCNNGGLPEISIEVLRPSTVSNRKP
jgi:MYXO-CTERM domain-containing protein